MENRAFTPGEVIVHTGPGKGKTTAALGLALTVVGRGGKGAVVQFLKGNAHTGELWAAARLYPWLEIYQFGRGCPYSALIRQGLQQCRGCGECFLHRRGPGEEEKEMVRWAWEKVLSLAKDENYRLLVCDEIAHAFRYRLLPVEEVTAFLARKPLQLTVVLTGRGMPDAIISLAHRVVEFGAVKHPFARGVRARRGIEY